MKLPPSLSAFLKKSLPRELVEAVRTAKRVAKSRRIDARNRRVVQSLLGSDAPVMIELGAGAGRMPGWTAIGFKGADILMDLHEPLPFPDSSVQEIYSSHCFEHFLYPDLIRLLQECHRVLKPGGRLRAAVPNARHYLQGYANFDGFDPDFFCRHRPAVISDLKIDVVNYIAYMKGPNGHRYMFDEENFPAVIACAGFTHAGLREFEPGLDLEERRYESLYASGLKRP